MTVDEVNMEIRSVYERAIWEVISPFRSHTCKLLVVVVDRYLFFQSLHPSSGLPINSLSLEIRGIASYHIHALYILAEESLILPDEEVYSFICIMCVQIFNMMFIVL